MSTQTIYNYLSGVTDAASTAAGDDFIILKGGSVQRVDQDKLLPSLDVSALTAATAIADADLLLVRQSTTNKKAAASLVLGKYLSGFKEGLDCYYVSSDLIRVKVGVVEVNNTMVVKSSVTDFTTGATNFPGAGGWVFICIDNAGTITLQTATGNGTVRPSDNCFAISGGSVGYDDIGKHGYYYDATHRIIGAAHRVGATSWYFVNLGHGIYEEGQNSRGKWTRMTNRRIVQYVSGSTTTNLNASNLFGSSSGTTYYANPVATNYPITFPNACEYIVTGNNYSGVNSLTGAINTSTSQFSISVSSGATNSVNVLWSIIAVGW